MKYKLCLSHFQFDSNGKKEMSTICSTFSYLYYMLILLDVSMVLKANIS